MKQTLAPQLVRWSGSLAWTALALYLMLAPGNNRQVDGLSKSAGGSDITDALGHVVIFSILALLWYWALLGRHPKRNALATAIGFSLGLGISTELAQTIIAERGASWLDLSANSLGIVIAVVCIVFQSQIPKP
jgi:VanZ family protein